MKKQRTMEVHAVADYESVRVFWKGKPMSSEADLDLALDNFRILFAYNSGRIENSEVEYHDTREIFENGRVLNYTGSPRALFEQQNQKLCYEFLRKPIVEKAPLSVALICEIHGILTSGTYDERRYIVNEERPGQFKKHDYVTGRQEGGYPPEGVPAALEELVAELNETSAGDLLKAAAYLHLRFEYIHPFADGNGRVGRTLTNYFLMTHGEPPLIVYDEDKKQYYAALEAYDTGEDIMPMVEFLREQTVKTWEKAVLRAEGAPPAKRKSLQDM